MAGKDKGQEKDVPGASDVEEAVEKLAEVEDLSDVDVGLDKLALSGIASQERMTLAIAWQRLTIQASNLRMSATANESVGNTQARDKFQKQLQDVETNLKHVLRSIKNIDREYPMAKELMQQQVTQQHIEQGLVKPKK
jgi:hypothetical protein